MLLTTTVNTVKYSCPNSCPNTSSGGAKCKDSVKDRNSTQAQVKIATREEMRDTLLAAGDFRSAISKENKGIILV